MKQEVWSSNGRCVGREFCELRLDFRKVEMLQYQSFTAVHSLGLPSTWTMYVYRLTKDPGPPPHRPCLGRKWG
uniref:Uncharacterized protein n=1 Tax=Anguilla anguilla TaxID=7936 RepID=A0A0E9WZC5_ANGAN